MEQNNECRYCKYRIQGDSNNQSCSKWVTNGNLSEPCDKNGLGENPGETDHNCMLLNCPSYCQFPFPKNVYNDMDEYYGSDNQISESLKDDPDRLNTYISGAIDPSGMIDRIKTSYNRSNKPTDLNLKSGELATPNENQTLNSPPIPTASSLREVVQEGARTSLVGIDWSSIKNTAALRETLDDGGIISGNVYTVNSRDIPISNNGIELEWWDSQYTDDQLKMALPESTRRYQDLESIHLSTGEILGDVFGHTRNNMVIEEVYDWLRKHDIEILNEREIMPPTMGNIFTITSFFGVDSDSATNREFEECMNNLMKTDHEDDEFMQRINMYQHISELGKQQNRKDLLYVENKILKFLTINPIDVGECLDLIYLTDKICNKGLSSNALQLLGIILNMETDNTTNDSHLDIVLHRLIKYVPDILHKIIEFAEYYEEQSCQKITHNTKLLRKIYTDVFVKNRSMNIVFPDFGLDNFFQGFQNNIFTKTILLLVFTYIFTHILSLFKVNYNIKQD